MPRPSVGGLFSSWFLIGLPVAISLLTLAGFLYARFFLPTSLRPRDADRAVLITIGDVESSLARFTPRTDAELFRKTRYPDGRIELRYDYLHPDAERPVYVLSVLDTHPSRQAAREAFAEMSRRETPEAPFDSVTYSQLDSSLSWAESAQFADLTQASKPRGYSFLCRRNEHIWRVELYGLQFGDVDNLRRLLVSRLELLDEYKP